MTENATSRVVIAVIGLDMPGIVAAVSSVLTGFGCNLEQVSQVTLHGQFAMIGLASRAPGLTNDMLAERLREEVKVKNLHQSILVRDFEEPQCNVQADSEPYVISIWGNDRNGIIAQFAQIFADHGINIEALRAFPVDPTNELSLQVFEVSMPLSIDRTAFMTMLHAKAKALDLRANMQHRDIFEAIHRVKVD